MTLISKLSMKIARHSFKQKNKKVAVSNYGKNYYPYIQCNVPKEKKDMTPNPKIKKDIAPNPKIKGGFVVSSVQTKLEPFLFMHLVH
jgi:transposase